MSRPTEEEASISYPSIAIVLGIAYILYRYLWASPSTTGSSSSQSTRNGLRFTPAQVEQVAQMFPQLSRRDIMWDLQRNRGSVQATTERVLGGRGLDVAPPSFQPLLPDPTLSSQQQSTTATTLASLLSKHQKPEQDLIQRYNLQSQISASDSASEKGKDKDTSAGASASGWATTKDARQDVLKRRRDEMILEARRKMMERDAKRRGESVAQ